MKLEAGSWICKTWNHDGSLDIFKLSAMVDGEYIYEPNTYYSNGKLLASTYISAGEINDDRVTYRLASTEEIEAIVNPPTEEISENKSVTYESIENKLKDGFKTGLIYPHNSPYSSAYSVIQTGKYVTKYDFLNIANWCIRESKCSKEEIAQFIKDVFRDE